MTIIIHRETEDGPAWGEPRCDRCSVTVSREAVVEGHGILNMGWARREAGKHFCPHCVVMCSVEQEGVGDVAGPKI